MGTKTTTSDAVYIWINTATGCIYISANAESNKPNWLEQNKVVYERQMMTGDKRIPEELHNDLISGHEFQSITMLFDNPQEGFDFGNQLVKTLKKIDRTYCKRAKVSQIRGKGELKEPKVFNSINEIVNTIENSKITDGGKIADLIESGLYNCACEDGVHIDKIEKITKMSNSYIRQQEIEKTMKEKKEPKDKYCPHCHMAIPLSGICTNFMCGHSGEKVL